MSHWIFYQKYFAGPICVHMHVFVDFRPFSLLMKSISSFFFQLLFWMMSSCASYFMLDHWKISLYLLDIMYDKLHVYQLYGEIRTIYTATKHRGFVMISYYDIRAARNAMRALQNKPLRRRKLDIHFSIPKVCLRCFLLYWHIC